MVNAHAGKLAAGDLSYGNIFRLALPMIAAYISVPLIGFVDMTVVGHLDDPKYIGGVAIGTIFFSTTYFIFFFLRWSTTGLTAQLFGLEPTEDRSNRLGETLVRALLLGVVISVLVMIVQRPALSIVLDIMEATPGVRQQASAYCSNRALGAPAALLGFALTGWFIGAAQPRSVFAMTLLANAINAGLSVFLIFRLGMTADGCGLAAAAGDWASFILGAVAFLRRHSNLIQGLSIQRIIDRETIVTLLMANAEIATKLVSTIVVMYALLIGSGRFGPVVLAANAVLLQLFYLASYVLDGFANACEALSGRAFGSGDNSALRKVIERCGRCSLAVGFGFALAYLVAGEAIAGFISHLPEVRATAAEYIVWPALLAPGMALAVMFEGVFVGTMRTAALRNCALLATIIFLILLWPTVTFGGNHGLWLMFLAYFVIRQSAAYFIYLRKLP